MLSQAYREYKLHQPQPGWMELDPSEVWNAVSDVIRRAASATPDDPVGAVSVSTHGESVVPIDASGRPTYGFITAIDTRATEQARWWSETLGRERIFELTGMSLHPMYTVNKLMWLRQYDPDVYNSAAHFLCMQDFVFHQLGLQPVMDRTLAIRTMAFDVRKMDWSEEILDLAGLDVELLSAVWPSGQIIGEIPSSVVADLNLDRGAVGVSGSHDQPSGALGCGAIAEGIAMDSTGTVECVAVGTPKLVLDPRLMDSNIPVAPHTVPGMYLVLGYSSTGGALLRWYRDNFAGKEVLEAERTGADVYDLILRQAVDEPSPVLILPHFIGAGTPSMDANSKGAILGLDLSTTRAEIIKAIPDSVSYEVKQSIDAMESAGIAVDELRAFGGGAKSPLWLQTKADIYGKLVRAMDVSEAPALGVALHAGVATGVFTSIEEGVSRMVRVGRTFEPNMSVHDQYMQKYEVFRQVYPALADLSYQL
jgi:xylulokinase